MKHFRAVLQASAADHAAGSGNSNRARRAKNADQLFTRAAGVLRPAGAALDGDGNAAGSEFDLGADGAFDGLKIVVLMEYVFDFRPAQTALEVRSDTAVVLQ